MTLSVLATLAATTRVYAQAPTDALSPQQVSLACALPPATSTARTGVLHVVGAQDTIPRSLFSERDLLVVDGGAARGVEVGQQYFVRRSVSSSVYSADAKAIVTAGWIRIVAANQATAIATVERSCGEIEAGDYLEAFVAPVVPAAAMADRPHGRSRLHDARPRALRRGRALRGRRRRIHGDRSRRRTGPRARRAVRDLPRREGLDEHRRPPRADAAHVDRRRRRRHHAARRCRCCGFSRRETPCSAATTSSAARQKRPSRRSARSACGFREFALIVRLIPRRAGRGSS